MTDKLGPRKAALSVAAVVLVVVLAGCGGTPSADPPTADASTTNVGKGRGRGPVTSLPLVDAYVKALAPGESVPLARAGVITIDRNASSLPAVPGPSAQDPPEAFGSADQLAAGRDGSLYASSESQGRIVRVDPAGVASIVVGADGVPIPPGPIAVDPDGHLWVWSGGAIRSIAPDGTITVVRDGLPAFTETELRGPVEEAVGKPLGAVAFPVDKIAVGAGGRLVLLTGGGGLLEVGTDGIVRRPFDPDTVVITDGGPKPPRGSGFESASDIELLADGTLLVLDLGAAMLRAVRPDGSLATWAGRSVTEVDLRVGPLDDAWDMTVTPEGTALVAFRAPGRIVEIGPDGKMTDWATDLFSPDRIARLADGTAAVRVSQDEVARVAGT